MHGGAWDAGQAYASHGGAAAPERGACPSAFGSSSKARAGARAAKGSAAGGGAAEPSRKAQRRCKRREEAKRTELLAKVKDALIRRALHEDHPENRGGCMWD